MLNDLIAELSQKWRFGMKSNTYLGIFLLLFSIASTGCNSTPCMTCHAMLFKGVNISKYLSTHPKPFSIKIEPDGCLEYKWIYSSEEKNPLELGSAIPNGDHLNQSTAAGGKRLESLLTDLLTLLSSKQGSRNIPEIKASTITETIYIVDIKTDAAGVVRGYSCDRLKIDLGGICIE
jgi:hypothetical protein